MPEETIVNTSTPRREYPKRERNRPFQMYFALLSVPTNTSEALESSKANEWKKAMDEEMNSHRQNHTWTLVELPPGMKPIKAQ